MQNKSKQSKIKKMSTRKLKQSKIKKMSTRKLKQSKIKKMSTRKSKKTKKMSTRKLKGYGEGEGIRVSLPEIQWYLKVRPENVEQLSFELPEYEDQIVRGVWKDLITKIFNLNKKYNNYDNRFNKEYLYKIDDDNVMTDKEYESEFEKILNAKFKLFPEYKTDFKKEIGSKSEGTRFYRTYKPLIFPDIGPYEGDYRAMNKRQWYKKALQKLENLNEKFNKSPNMSEKDYKIEVKKILGTGDFYQMLKQMMVI
jgi:hypothetical protein